MRVKTMIAAAALVAAGAGPARAQQQVNVTRNTGPTGAVEIQNPTGEVRVVAWDRNQVQVTGTLGSDRDRVDVEDEGDGVVVRVVPRGGNGYGGHGGRGSSIEVRVPARKDLEVNVVAAGVTVTGMAGNVEAHSVSGPVRVTGGRSRHITAVSRSGPVDVDATAERVEANSMSGPVTVGGTVRDRVEANSVSGTVRITAATGEVEAGSVSGDVEIASMRGRAEVHSVSGGIRVTGRGLSGTFQTVAGGIVLSGDLARDADLELTTHSGDVTLQLAANASASVEMTTFSGGISVDYPGARVQRENRRNATARVGAGDASVTVSTFSGDVKLTRR
ncbi:DUF4097 family beta strand repeat-containing protein [Longimicrobium sp.]|uniref:DUF4097 family beta strand repeat-containing protein n=1 Tax=Longimicrobium sp. TaxID=2029185 RepID=UPI002BA6D0E6|nr:DUF4097 family beta strand repeat-containing protein [Longimicrobium sp.]HSU17009.1 DUF4097 family beta strand repeat-containing protein [Longimicrobium sp.]